jgi:hypothetical protein
MKNKVRPTAINKIFNDAHIEFAKNPIAAQRYCIKEDTRIEGPFEYGDYNNKSTSKIGN